jgi:hypothetical protein
MRNQVAEIAATLALQRWLESQDVPFALIQASPFTSPDRRTLLLGGRRVNILPTRISAVRRIQDLQAEPSQLLETEASIPNDVLSRTHQRGHDLLVFLFLLSQETRTTASLRRADAVGERTHLIAIPPLKPWRNLTGRAKLERLSVKNEGEHTVELTFYSQLGDQNPHVLPLRVPARRQVPIPVELAAIHYIYAAHLPTGRIRVVDNKAAHTWIIPVRDWINIWIYGKEIILAGWSTLTEVRRKSSPASDVEHIPVRPQIMGKGIRLPLHQLRPMRELIERTLQG